MSQRVRRQATMNRPVVVIDSDEDEDGDDEVEPTQVVIRKASTSKATASEKRKQKSKDNDEAPSTSKKRRRPSEKDDGDYAASQADNGSDLSAEEKEQLVGDFMRYVLAQDSQKLPAHRKDTMKNLQSRGFGNLKNWVVEQSKQRFKDIFGYELVEIKKKESQKMYILKNLISQDVWNQLNIVSLTDFEKQQRGLLLTILGMILISNQVLDSESLYDQLKRLGIREGEPHPVFGEWEKLIDNAFVKQLYLTKKKSQDRTRNGKVMYEYKIGPRAIIELDKRKILEFVAGIYGEQLDPIQLKSLEIEEEEVDGDDDEEGEVQKQNQVPSSQAKASQSTSTQRRYARK